MARSRHIVGVRVADRVRGIPDVQTIFAELGCHSKTRLGLREVQDSYCSPHGIIVLDTICEDDASRQMMATLPTIEGIEVRKMTFTRD